MALDEVQHATDLGHAPDAHIGRGIEPLPALGEVADGPDRVASDDQRAHVRRAAQTLGEHLRPAVEPDDGPAR